MKLGNKIHPPNLGHGSVHHPPSVCLEEGLIRCRTEKTLTVIMEVGLGDLIRADNHKDESGLRAEARRWTARPLVRRRTGMGHHWRLDFGNKNSLPKIILPVQNLMEERWAEIGELKIWKT